MNAKNSHCSYCGNAFTSEQLASSQPRHCASCGNLTYFNPLPVAVALIPVDDGLLLIRRMVEPHIGSLALPGGFIEVGETWQQAGAREVWEETGLKIDADEITLYDARSAPDGTLLVFGLARPRAAAEVPAFAPNAETSELVIIAEETPLAFPLHAQVAARFWQEKSGNRPPA